MLRIQVGFCIAMHRFSDICIGKKTIYLYIITSVCATLLLFMKWPIIYDQHFICRLISPLQTVSQARSHITIALEYDESQQHYETWGKAGIKVQNLTWNNLTNQIKSVFAEEPSRDPAAQRWYSSRDDGTWRDVFVPSFRERGLYT